MLARKFLYIVAGLIMLTLGSALAYRLWGQQMLAAVMVPSARFEAPAPLAADAYDDKAMWIARPDLAGRNPSAWLPDGAWRPAVPGHAAIFFVHPTSYTAPFNKAKWNAPLDDAEANKIAISYVRLQASALTSAGAVWAPRYRQAHFGAFMRAGPNRDAAIDAAYRDVEAAFAAFLAANPSGPIIIAGHSQGTLLAMRLLRDHVADKPVARRIVAAYLVGWPVSLTADVPALGLPACTRADQGGCILSWQSFAEPADPSSVVSAYADYPGMTGDGRRGTPMLCVNPLTGAPGTTAGPAANFGTLAPGETDASPMRLVKNAVPARCATSGREQGFLLIGDPPSLGPYALPGNNYHVYDYALFWANIRLDASKRLTAFLGH